MYSQIFYFILALILVFYLFGIYTGSLKVKAKRICSIYKILKPDYPLNIRSKIEEKEIQRNTAIIYLRTMRIEDEKIYAVVDSILPILEMHNYEIQHLIIEILHLEYFILHYGKVNSNDVMQHKSKLLKKINVINNIVYNTLTQ